MTTPVETRNKGIKTCSHRARNVDRYILRPPEGREIGTTFELVIILKIKCLDTMVSGRRRPVMPQAGVCRL